MPLILEAENLEKIVTVSGLAVPILKSVDLQVERGEFVVVLGPSGSGKSTLLYLLGGVDRPSSGMVRIAGTDLSGLSENELTLFRREHTGFVFQNFNLIPSLNVFENIALPFIIARRTRTQD